MRISLRKPISPREGYELMVGKPQILTKKIDGKLHEPLEHLTVDCPEEFVGVVMEQEVGGGHCVTHALRDGSSSVYLSSGGGWIGGGGRPRINSAAKKFVISAIPFATATVPWVGRVHIYSNLGFLVYQDVCPGAMTGVNHYTFGVTTFHPAGQPVLFNAVPTQRFMMDFANSLFGGFGGFPDNAAFGGNPNPFTLYNEASIVWQLSN